MPLIGSFGAASGRGFGFSSAGQGPYDVDYVVVAGGGNTGTSSYAFGTNPDYTLNTANTGTITFKIKCEYNKLGGCTGAT